MLYLPQVLWLSWGDLKNIGNGWVDFEARFGKASCEYSFAFCEVEIEITPLNASGSILQKSTSIYYAVTVTSAENWVSLHFSYENSVFFIFALST